MAASTSPDYSTLEFHDKNRLSLLPEVHQEKMGKDDSKSYAYSSLPEVVETTPPEVVTSPYDNPNAYQQNSYQVTAYQVVPNQGTTYQENAYQGNTYHPSQDAQNEKGLAGDKRERGTICGMHKRGFFVIVGIVAVLILAAGIGGGVGAALFKSSKKSSSKSSASGSSSSSSSGGGSDGAKAQILPNSRIAAVNYTDAQNVVHSRVYFQADSLALFQSDWRADTNKWTVSPVAVADNTTAVTPVNGTDISAYVYWQSATEANFHLYFVDTTNQVREYYSTLSNSAWTTGDGSAKHTAAANSSLGSWGKSCAVCEADNFFVYEVSSPSTTSTTSALAAAFRTGSSQWPASAAGADVSPIRGGAIAIAPVLSIEGTRPQVAMYVNAGFLREVYYNGSAWVDTGMPETTPLNPTSGIAAMTQDLRDVLFVQVLTSAAGGGVALTAWNGTGDGAWTQGGAAALAAFEGVVDNSPLAANQLGRVYAWTAASGSGGGASELMEWASTNDGKEVVFEKVGAVVVDVP